MDIRKGIAPAIALLAIAMARCGGGDSAPMSTSAGTGGSAGTAGVGGSAGSAGSKAGSSGANASDGSIDDDADNGDSAGSGGSTGSDGSTGAAGSMGSGGSAGASADGAAGSAGAKSDAAVDGAKSDSASADAGDASACPAQEPVNADPCTGSAICTYGDVGCACVKAMGPGREWQCRRTPDAARDPDCPASEPAGTLSCVDAGAGTLCRYPGNVFCVCDQVDRWRCNR